MRRLDGRSRGFRDLQHVAGVQARRLTFAAARLAVVGLWRIGVRVRSQKRDYPTEHEGDQAKAAPHVKCAIATAFLRLALHDVAAQLVQRAAVAND